MILEAVNRIKTDEAMSRKTPLQRIIESSVRDVIHELIDGDQTIVSDNGFSEVVADLAGERCAAMVKAKNQGAG